LGGLVFNQGAKLKKQGIVELNDNESQNQRMYLKQQMKKDPTNMSEFKSGMGSESKFLDGQQFTDSQSDGSYVLRVEDNTSQRSKRRFKFGTSMRGSMQGSVRSSVKGSIRS